MWQTNMCSAFVVLSLSAKHLWIQRGGGGGGARGLDPPPPWKVTGCYIGFLRSSGMDPLKKQLDQWVQLLPEGGLKGPL